MRAVSRAIAKVAGRLAIAGCAAGEDHVRRQARFEIRI
jgi:hypothetical protein